MHDPIAYSYDAALHCPGCARARFGRCAEHGQIACCVEDSEGNEPGVVAPWDELECGEACDDCHGELADACGDCKRCTPAKDADDCGAPDCAGCPYCL